MYIPFYIYFPQLLFVKKLKPFLTQHLNIFMDHRKKFEKKYLIMTWNTFFFILFSLKNIKLSIRKEPTQLNTEKNLKKYIY